jgi:hypothetical protein
MNRLDAGVEGEILICRLRSEPGMGGRSKLGARRRIGRGVGVGGSPWVALVIHARNQSLGR